MENTIEHTTNIIFIYTDDWESLFFNDEHQGCGHHIGTFNALEVLADYINAGKLKGKIKVHEIEINDEEWWDNHEGGMFTKLPDDIKAKVGI